MRFQQNCGLLMALGFFHCRPCRALSASSSSPWRKRIWIFPLLLACVCSTACQEYLAEREPAASAEVSPAEPAGIESAVSCLGRIEPKDGVTRLSAPYYEGRPALVRELRVEEGDWVEAGQIIAVLNSRKTFEARVRQREARLPVLRTRLAQVKEGPKQSDVAAQKAEIGRRRSALELARADHLRYKRLHETRDVSDSQLDQKRGAVQDAERMLEQAIEQLNSLTDIRRSDVELAESELQAANKDVEQARAELELSVVRAPSKARILTILAQEGEEVGMNGLVDLGRTDQMYVVAEVYETDIGNVDVGDRATIRGDILPSELQGTVERIGMQIDKGAVLPSDPVEFADARVVKVEIRLEESRPAADLIHGRVAVTIHP